MHPTYLFTEFNGKYGFIHFVMESRILKLRIHFIEKNVASPIGKIKTNLTMSLLDVSCAHCRPRYCTSAHSQVVHVVLNRKWIGRSGKLTLQHQNKMKRRLENVPGCRFFGRCTQLNGHVLHQHQTSYAHFIFCDKDFFIGHCGGNDVR